ncbi:PqqD family peptide modification chaperone [Amycolatopsis cynarae]|uniref:PqqD family peptide modification chaperone n=1 Tax=Amycolatopsis cynarae TaxID=2995223 RepID=UPI003898F415
MITLKPGISMATIDGRTVLLDGDTGRYWEMNKSASTILRDLLNAHSIEKICAQNTTRRGRPSCSQGNGHLANKQGSPPG